jgi:hypothetical protein
MRRTFIPAVPLTLPPTSCNGDEDRRGEAQMQDELFLSSAAPSLDRPECICLGRCECGRRDNSEGSRAQAAADEVHSRE